MAAPTRPTQLLSADLLLDFRTIMERLRLAREVGDQEVEKRCEDKLNELIETRLNQLLCQAEHIK